MTKEKLLEQAKRHWKIAQAAWAKQREREKDDLRFQVPEEQWTEQAKKDRKGGFDELSGQMLPARPMLSISRIAQPVQLVLNQERAAHLGVSIQPLSAEADPDTAAIMEGIYRRIERDSQAHIPRSWGFARAAKCGMGAYRVGTRYEDYTDDPFDQCITIERILHQEAVYFDPAATKPDFSDGNYAFVAQWMPLADFKAQYPNADVAESDAEAWADMFSEDPEWVDGGGEKAAVLVAEYWWKEKEYVEMISPADKTKKRKREEVAVKRVLLCGWELLGEIEEWNGHLIPLIPVIGQELHPYDSERRWAGIITDAKDPQRAYNAAFSNAVETAAMEPKAPYTAYAEQIEGYEAEWQQSNVRNFPVLRHKMVMVGGQPLPPPQRTQIDSGKLNLSLQLLQMADQGLQAATQTYDPALGRTSNREKSGRAIMALQQQGEEGNSHFMHNLADISMNYEARVVLDLIPAIYDRPGRLARTLSEEDKSDTVMLNAPFVQGPDGRPMPAPEGPPPGPPPGPPMGGNGQSRSMPPPGMMASPPGQQMQMPMQPGQPMPPPSAPPPQPKTYDLKKGIYSVAISIGKTRQSALQEGAEEIGQMLQSMPNLGPVIMPTYLRFRDFPGAKELGELLAKVRDAQMPFLAETKEGEQPTPEQLSSKVQAQQAQLEQMGKQIEEMGKALETKQVEQAGKVQIAQMDNETKLRIASEENDTKLNLAAIQAQLKEVLEAIKMGHESKQAEADRELSALETAAKLPPPDLTWKGPNEVPVTDPLGGKEI